ncbi:MAG: FecR domain-containing protein [SAR324 cluster bacterium]|nr:FecR domain-containing protein [SAR324 cluster bacterium]
MFLNQLKTIGIAVSLSLAFGSVLLAEEVGTLESEEGKVLIIRGSETQEVEEFDEVPVFAKDIIQTGEESAALLILGDGENSDQISLDEKTTFKIEEYKVSADDKPTRGTLNLLGGKVRSLVNQAKGRKEIQVTTSSATIGVKGTDFLVEVPNPEVTQVTTFEGSVALQNRLGDVLKEVSIGGGFSSMVMAGTAPSSPFELSRESLLESSSLIARPSSRTQEPLNARELTQENTLQGFHKAQFDRIVEDAARVKGSLIRVKIEFPADN